MAQGVPTMKIRLSALVSACALAYPFVPAQADDAQLGHVVVTATRQPITADEALASVDVIDRDEIARAGNSSLVQLLSSRPGVQVASNGGPGSSSSVYIRGAESRHTLLLIDGMRVGSATLGSPTLETIPMELIDRIEILRGPASALYGADAVGGVIQIFTRRGRDGFQPSARVGFGSDNARSYSATLAGGVDQLSYSFSFGHDRSDGINAIPSSFDGRDQDADGFENDYASGAVRLRIGADDEIGLNFLSSDMRNWSDAGTPFDSYVDKKSESAGMYVRKALSSDWTSTLRLARSLDESRDRWDSDGFSKFDTEQTQFSWQNDIAVAGGLLLAGYEFLRQEVDTTGNFPVNRRDIKSVLLGWGGELRGHDVQLNARHDRNSQFGNKSTGAVAYGYRFNPEWRVRASIGNAFNAPGFSQLYYPLQWGYKGNPDLKPETALNREVGLIWERGVTSVAATYFNNRIKNLIDWRKAGAVTTPLNVDVATIEGLELALVTVVGDYRVRATIDHLDAKDDSSGDRLGRRARLAGALAVERSLGKWTVGGEWNAQGARYDDTPNSAANRMGGYGLLNAYVHYALAPDWSVEVRANNILDKDYELAQNYGTQGANAFVAVRYAMH